ncbi:MAG: pyridoxamine 5'-phosphate oxidase family protein [Actinomycetota bacterium]|nr:pyridoxamine 5'-phosphate oxidase family protein [Actinomycetota bacterium]
MGKVYQRIDPRLVGWIEAQPVFFVATAPLAADGLVNLSPRGIGGTFRVLDEHTFSFADLTGSGIETVAHLRENGRICVMFCAFHGPPKIVRLHGTGTVVLRDEPGFDAALEPFAAAVAVGARQPATRAVIRVDVHRISDSCGYGVPLMDLRAERDVLDSWSDNKGPDGLARWHAERNAVSLDGLPGMS